MSNPNSNEVKLLIVEDDPLAFQTFKSFLNSNYKVFHLESSESFFNQINDLDFDIAFIDLDLEKKLAGLDIVEELNKRGTYSIVLSGREEDENIEAAYLKGAQDYLLKPISEESFELVMSKFQLLNKLGTYKNQFREKMITNDEVLIKQLDMLPQVSLSKKPILIQGPTGTGKSNLAKVIFDLMYKDKGDFVELNCSETPEDLLESELFGYKKGAFTGASTDKKGKLELANGGVLFLDEIGSMPMSLQQKLLKAIEEKSFYPLGSEEKVSVDFQLISASCEDIDLMVSNGEFRIDLYYRIEGYNLQLDPLIKRKDDITQLISFFIKSSPRKVVFTNEAMDSLLSYSWPGNIRELKKIIEMACALGKGIVDKSDLPERFYNETKPVSLKEEYISFVDEYGLNALLEKIEQEVVDTYLTKNKGKVRKTLADLKISNNTFYRIKRDSK